MLVCAGPLCWNETFLNSLLTQPPAAQSTEDGQAWHTGSFHKREPCVAGRLLGTVRTQTGLIMQPCPWERGMVRPGIPVLSKTRAVRCRAALLERDAI